MKKLIGILVALVLTVVAWWFSGPYLAVHGLSKAIEQSRTQLRTDIVNARRVLSGATFGAAALSIIAAIAVALGLWPRLSEYR